MFIYVMRTFYVHPKCQLYISLCVGNQFLAVTIHFGTFICIWIKNIRLICLQMAAGIWENSEIIEKWFNYFRHLYCSDRSEKLIPYSELSYLFVVQVVCNWTNRNGWNNDVNTNWFSLENLVFRSSRCWRKQKITFILYVQATITKIPHDTCLLGVH